MSDGYDSANTSVDEAEPYFLYLFNNGVSEPTRLTSEPDEVIADPEATGIDKTWLPSPVMHGDVEQAANIERNSLDVTFPLSDSYARTLLSPASEITTVTIWRGQRSAPGVFRVWWKGHVDDATAAKETIKVEVLNVYTRLRQPGCRARYMRTCRHALYFTGGCNVNLDDWKVPATVLAVSGGVALTVAEAAAETDAFYKAGLVIYDGLYGWIGDHVGDQLTLVGEIEGLADKVASAGSADVFIAPGCDLSPGENGCSKFNNILNYGGFWWMSDNNPFSQSIT